MRSYKFTDDDIDYILVDTPGFNDTNYTDDVIMTRILAWLESSYRQGTKLNGLIYLHRIIDPRMQGTALQNLRMFRKLCGSNCMPNIVLATTFWGNVTPRVGDAREKELCESSEFWGEMIKKGSQVVRLQQDDRESGLKIVREIAKKNRITLEAQRELVEENKSASETAAARIINEELQKIERDMKKKIKKEREEAKLEIARQAAARDERLRQEWQEMTRIAAEKRREEKRREREEAAYWEDYWRQKREIEEAERARIQRERDQLESELQEIERLQRIQQEAENARQRYYRNYVCIGKSMSGRYCDRCSSSLHSRWVHYYREFLHCGSSCTITC